MGCRDSEGSFDYEGTAPAWNMCSGFHQFVPPALFFMKLYNTTRILFEKAIEVSRALYIYICLIDFTKAKTQRQQM